MERGRKEGRKEQEKERKKGEKKVGNKIPWQHPQAIQTHFQFITPSLIEDNSKDILYYPCKFCCDVINFMYFFGLLSTKIGRKQKTTDAASLCLSRSL